MSERKVRLPLGVTLLPGLDEVDAGVCTAGDCPLPARVRVLTGEGDDMAVNVVCLFHALLYTSVALQGMLDGEAP